jgi:Zn-dependent protease
VNIIPNFNAETFLGFMLGFVLGTTIHEFMHAYSALRLGDDTAARQGRVTLNPVAHFDPLGFFMGVLLALRVGFIAWGKPVPVNSSHLRFGRRGMSIVAVAGPISNLVLATVLVLILKVGESAMPDTVFNVIANMIYINLLLFAFNLIPIPPLDGFNILVGILPNYWVMVLEPIRRYSIPILLGLVFVVPLLGRQLGISLDPVGQALNPIINLLQNIFFGGFAR